jgi:Ribonucleotide reductase, alpha subunit
VHRGAGDHLRLRGYPTPEIAENSRRFRPLGLGYCNLGALLMRSGIGYDSDEGREYAAAITALMGGQAYRVSAELAGIVGPFEGFAENREEMLDVLRLHRDAARGECRFAGLFVESTEAMCIAKQAANIWIDVVKQGNEHGFRNSQVTLLAPTGTIGMVMDADTTGVEPEYDLVTYKTLASGGIARRVSGSVREALWRSWGARRLRFSARSRRSRRRVASVGLSTSMTETAPYSPPLRASGPWPPRPTSA